MNSSNNSAKQQVVNDIRKAIQVLDMFKTSHKKAKMEHFIMVIEDLESSIKDLEKTAGKGKV